MPAQLSELTLMLLIIKNLSFNDLAVLVVYNCVSMVELTTLLALDTAKRCYGARENSCEPHRIWGRFIGGNGIVFAYMQPDFVLNTTALSLNSAFSVRCVLEKYIED